MYLNSLIVRTFICTEQFEPPISVHLVDIHSGQAVLKWTPVDSTCVSIGYNITSNCSICSPMTRNLTTSSCPVPQPTTDVIVCVFSVQGVVCDNLIGTSSSSVVVTLQGIQYYT